MVRIPDAVNVASLDTHCLIVTVPHDGAADVSSSLPRSVAADVLRQIADQLEAGPCPTAAATGQPCPIHDAPTSPSRALLDAGRGAAEAAARGIRQGQQRPHPFGLDPEQAQRAGQRLGEAFAAFGRKLREAAEQAAANAQQTAEQDDPRPRIEVDLEQPAEPEPVDTPPATPTVVKCAHEYGLLRDSCPGCDAEQERPHEADPVTVRPAWAKRDMRRCRRCALVPSHPIHRKARAEQ